MKIETKKLKDVMKKLKPAFNRGGISGFNEYVFFDDNHIFAYNEDVKISIPFKCGFSAGLPSSEFFKFLNKVNTDEIDFIKNEDSINIKSGRVKAVFKDNISLLERMEDMPKCPEEYNRLPSNFMKGIELTLYTVSNKEDSITSMISIIEDQITSTDNYRMSKYIMDNTMNIDILIPGKKAKELIKFEPSFFTVEDNYIHFVTDDDIIISFLLGEGNLPDVNEYINNETGDRILLPENIDNMIDITSIMTDDVMEIDKKIEITIDNGKILCKANNDIGFIESENEIDIAGSFKFDVNPMFFATVLKNTKEMILNQENNFIIFYYDNYRYLMGLIG